MTDIFPIFLFKGFSGNHVISSFQSNTQLFSYKVKFKSHIQIASVSHAKSQNQLSLIKLLDK